jgi:hypothetical protein
MAEVSQQIFLGTDQVFGFYDNKWTGINSYEVSPPAPTYVVRTDAYGSSVIVAVPGSNFTPFGGTFGQTNFQSDISAAVRGSGANQNLIVTSSSATNVCIISSSVVNSGSYDFANAGGYYTSVFQEDGGSMGAVFGTAFSDFTSTDWVIETWVYLQERLYVAGGPPFHKSIIRNTDTTFATDISFVADNSPLSRLRFIRGGNQYFSSNIASNLNAWYHVAFSFTSSTNTINGYWQGTRILNTASTSGGVSANLWYRLLGGDMGVNDGAKGSLQDYRITIGSNRGYTGATITPPDSIVKYS